MSVDASAFRLVSTPASKYAHVPARVTGDESAWWGDTACNQSLPTYDKWDPFMDRHAEGKPPCPRCASRLRWRIEWLSEFADSYDSLGEGSA